MEAKGTKNLKEVVELLLAVNAALAEAQKDNGKVGVEDAGQLIKLIPVIGPALEGIGEVPAEIADLSPEEAQELVALVVAKLAVDSPKAKAVVNASFKAISGVLELVKALKA